MSRRPQAPQRKAPRRPPGLPLPVRIATAEDATVEGADRYRSGGPDALFDWWLDVPEYRVAIIRLAARTLPRDLAPADDFGRFARLVVACAEGMPIKPRPKRQALLRFDLAAR